MVAALDIATTGFWVDLVEKRDKLGGNVLDIPWGIAVDGAGNVYVSGSDNVFKLTLPLSSSLIRRSR